MFGPSDRNIAPEAVMLINPTSKVFILKACRINSVYRHFPADDVLKIF